MEKQVMGRVINDVVNENLEETVNTLANNEANKGAVIYLVMPDDNNTLNTIGEIATTVVAAGAVGYGVYKLVTWAGEKNHGLVFL